MPSKSSTTQKVSQYISIKEAARILNVHPETLRRWDNSGKLKAVRVGKSSDPKHKHRKYRPADLIKILERR